MLTTVLTGVSTMIPASGRRTHDRSSTRLTSCPGETPVTNSLTPWIAGLAATLTFWGAATHAQEPIVEPEPVVEASDAASPAVEPEPVVESSSRATPVVDPPSRVARLGFVEGEVSVAPAGTEEWAEAVLNRPLTSGDRVWTESGARAELQIGSAAVYLDGDTGFGFIELDDGVLQASLTEGAATLRVRRLAEGETIQVETPHSTVVLNHVGEYHLEVDKTGDRTIVKTRSGEAEVKGGAQTFTVRDNERGVFAGLETLTGRVEPLGPRTAFENWANDRDARNERSQSAKYVSRDVIGYEDLDDNGEWISEPAYGYVWRPRYVPYDWAPYRYGRWAYVSPWGWSWIDDARWGFAPFHYGRWAHVRDRWCWVPGPRHIRPIYAPALVGWVGGPSVGVSISFGSGVGWYPLGPRDYYYPGYRHTPRYGRYVNVSNTIIVNNNYFYGGRRRPPPDFDYRRYPHAVTAVSRDQFVGGRPINGRWLRMDEGNLRRWRAETQPPAIAPYRESVLAGQTRQPPRDLDRFRAGRQGDSFAGRVPFHTERRAIETNGGRPVGRTELQDSNRNPKEGRGDFHAVRQVGSDINRSERERASQAPVLNRPRELNNDSVRDLQNRRDRERSAGSSPRVVSGNSLTTPRNAERNSDRERQRVEIMQADESRQEARETRRRDHMQRPPSSNSFQQGSNGFYRAPTDSAREPSRQPSRQLSQPRSEPRRDVTPPSRQEPRSQPQPRSNTERSQSRSSSRDDGGGGSGGNRGGNRPWNTAKDH